MVGRLRLAGLAATMVLAGPPAWASGPGTVAPWYIDQFGGEASDLAQLYDGRLGVVMFRAPRPKLYLAWRLLHGQQVGPVAGKALSMPCCDPPGRWIYDATFERGSAAWTTARKVVPGASEIDWIETERDGPDYTSIPNCFDEAFETAAATLKDRTARFGATSAAVKHWLAGQDAVFATCHETGHPLPELPADAPGWLTVDRAYQAAAHALYDQRFDEAAGRFAEIARDKASPWRPSASYLRVRSLIRAALTLRTPDAFARARAGVAELQRMPVATYGRAEAQKMLRALSYRDQPAVLMVELERELGRRDPPDDIAVSFRDYADLYDQGVAKPEAMDWIATLQAKPTAKALEAAYGDTNSDAALAALTSRTRADALAHARDRWARTSDPAWLIAALSLVDPGALEVPGLLADAGKVGASHPAWLTVQFHSLRLTLATAPAPASRKRLDALLQRPDLSASDRNLFTAQRAQVASDLREFAKLALRKRVCANDQADGCVRGFWQTDAYQEWSLYDGIGREGVTGLGEDARAVIDRLPLATRIELSRDAQLPASLRLDVALTSFARAVILSDNASADGMARDLETLLPQMAGDWRRARTAPMGPEKRFAQFMIFAKIPGLRLDLVDYTRPEGTVAQFQRYWVPWMVLPRGRPVIATPPSLARYQMAGVEPDSDARADLTCLGECGHGAAGLRMPDFAAATSAQADSERGYFINRGPVFDFETPLESPPGARSMWDEILVYARANPTSPEVPEALYWLVRVGRWGGSHDHSGRRAFELLHARYPASAWTKRTPYYYD
ncbi:hypothetical protein [Phenylobacterium sp.]|jgi:hypothetical protein|uniref:hypothetical protein n=1 Tax=Phenylobacterium sp. TaxID=1871053 RepID=UPI0037CC101C